MMKALDLSQGDHEGNLEAADEDGFQSDQEFVADLGRVVDDPDYPPPQYLRTGRHSSFINFAIFHLKRAGFDLGSSPEMEEGCAMLNDESFEKHVSQGDHDS